MEKLVGIATRTRDDPQLARLLASLDEQTERPARHVVVGKTVAQARNDIVETAQERGAEAVLFIDTDETPANPDWVREITDFRGADIVAGLVIPVEVRNAGARYLADLEKALSAAVPQDQTRMLTGNSAWKVEVFRALQERYGYLYDEALWFNGSGTPGPARTSYGGEDWELNLRVKEMGFKVRFNAAAGVYHDYSDITFPIALTKRYRYCLGGSLAYLKNRGELGGAIVRSFGHPIDYPIRAAAFARALLLRYAGI